MAKLTLSDLANLANESSAVATINSNSDAIETAVENTLSRDGTSPNEMNANLDMNGYRILNLPPAQNPSDPVRLDDIGEEINAAASEIVLSVIGAWTPVFSVVTDGVRRVQKVVDWVGGSGAKPDIDVYVGSSGFVTDITQAVDIRGAPGQTGDGSGDMLAENNLSDLDDAAAARSNLGLGALATENTVDNSDWSGADLSVANGGTGASDAGTALNNLGGQPASDVLTSLTGLSSNGLLVKTGTGAVTVRGIQGTADQILVSNGDGVSGSPVISANIASQSEAQAGSNNTKLMTPLRVSQAIAAIGGSGGSQIDYQAYTTPGAFLWTKPTGFSADSIVIFHGWGAGASGSTGSSRSGGAGGAYKPIATLRLGDLPASVSGYVGQGGQTVTAHGESTTFGDYLTAQGGFAATGSTPGKGGASFPIGDINAGGTYGAQGGTDGGDSQFGGGGAGASGNQSDSGGGSSEWGGGGGGGGYGTSGDGRAGGTSTYGGNGGTGQKRDGTPAADGQQPGGGGGGGASGFGKGGHGKFEIWVIG